MLANDKNWEILKSKLSLVISDTLLHKSSTYKKDYFNIALSPLAESREPFRITDTFILYDLMQIFESSAKKLLDSFNIACKKSQDAYKFFVN